MRRFTFAAAATGLLLTAPGAHAQTAVAPENVKAEDVAMSPLSDLNVRKKAVPVVLEAAMARSYDLAGIKTCKGLTTAIVDLDAALGDDIDVATGEKSDEENIGNGAGAVAKSVISGFIPFRGVIREVSGAAGAERRYNAAVDAGIARRGYLRGIARVKGCKRAPAETAAAN